LNGAAPWRWLRFSMKFPEGQFLLAGWVGAMSLVAFLLFGFDKWQAGRRGGRVAESTLCLVSALGGWPGGFLGIALFRHKSAKGSFQLKFAAAPENAGIGRQRTMRIMCYRCFWPASLCWCGSLHPMPTRTRFVFLMHPKEYKEEKAGTGRLTHLCLPNSELHMGKGFDEHEDVQALLADPMNYAVLLYPGRNALNLSDTGSSEQEAASPEKPVSGLTLPTLRGQLESRRLVVFLLDATWSGARKMLRLSPSLQRLPRIMFTPTAPSRYIIKQQPQEGCLSTLEAVHELLLVLERNGLDRYEQPAQLLGLFDRMQRLQMEFAADPNRPGYRRQAYSDPAQRTKSRGERGNRRDNFLQQPPAPALTLRPPRRG
jgi:DTW domain-containing protein YfiP/uncharacterized membrane protein YsdA (DUF1294 family)